MCQHKLGAKLYRRYLGDTFNDKAFQSHDHNTGGDHTCPVQRGVVIYGAWPFLCHLYLWYGMEGNLNMAMT